jgi:hypothetical protein
MTYFGWLVTAGIRFNVVQAQKAVAEKFSTQPEELQSVRTHGLGIRQSSPEASVSQAAISLAESMALVDTVDTESLKLEGS